MQDPEEQCRVLTNANTVRVLLTWKAEGAGLPEHRAVSQMWVRAATLVTQDKLTSGFYFLQSKGNSHSPNPSFSRLGWGPLTSVLTQLRGIRTSSPQRRTAAWAPVTAVSVSRDKPLYFKGRSRGWC